MACDRDRSRLGDPREAPGARSGHDLHGAAAPLGAAHRGPGRRRGSDCARGCRLHRAGREGAEDRRPAGHRARRRAGARSPRADRLDGDADGDPRASLDGRRAGRGHRGRGAAVLHRARGRTSRAHDGRHLPARPLRRRGRCPGCPRTAKATRRFVPARRSSSSTSPRRSERSTSRSTCTAPRIGSLAVEEPR